MLLLVQLQLIMLLSRFVATLCFRVALILQCYEQLRNHLKAIAVKKIFCMNGDFLIQLDVWRASMT